MSEKEEKPTEGETPEEPVKPQEKPEQEPPVSPPADEQDTDEFDKDRAMATINKLREIEKQAKKDQKRLQELEAAEKKRVEAEMSETERLQKQAEEAQARAAQLETELLRRDVIAETGLPAVLAERLKGSTKEEMLADAKELQKSLPLAKTPPRVPPTNPQNGDQHETEAQMRERLFGKPADILNIEEIRKHGGGVLWNTNEE